MSLREKLAQALHSRDEHAAAEAAVHDVLSSVVVDVVVENTPATVVTVNPLDELKAIVEYAKSGADLGELEPWRSSFAAMDYTDLEAKVHARS